MPRVVVITPPAGSPVSLDQAKAQCRAKDFDDDDDLITRLIQTATAWLDGPASWLGKCLTPWTLELRQETFSASGRTFAPDFSGSTPWEAYESGSKHAIMAWSPTIKLPCGPVQSIVNVSYVDDNGDTIVIDPSQYVLNEDELSPEWNIVWPDARGDRDCVRIRYITGYPLVPIVATPTTPPTICHAILLLVSHWYRNPDAVVGVENRDSSTELPLGVESLLSPYREYV